MHGPDREPHVVLDHLYKVFGDQPDAAMGLVEQGSSKDDIFARTGMTVGVRDASLTIGRGETFVVMGLSGSGKSTLLRMINRLIEPTSGRVEIGGRDVTAMPHKELVQLRRRNMSMVFQSFALLPHLTVLENAAFGLEIAGVGKRQRRDRAMAALADVGLEANASSYPDELSGGMQQRVGLARALATDPELTLMDEAFSALDPLIRTEMQDQLVSLQRERSRTVVFISHDLDEAMRIGDRIAIMEGGRVLQAGTPDEILKHPADDHVRSFFGGVDISNVYSAGDVARRDEVPVLHRKSDDVTAALARLRAHRREFGHVIDDSSHFVGAVSVDSLVRASRKTAHRHLDGALLDVQPVDADKGFPDVLRLVARSACPLAVVDDRGRYVGAISKNRVLETLVSRGEAA